MGDGSQPGPDAPAGEEWSVFDRGGGHLKIRSARPDIYGEMVDDRGLFPFKYHLFCAGLVYGLLHKKRLDPETDGTAKKRLVGNAALLGDKKQPSAPGSDMTEFIGLSDIADQEVRDVVDLVYRVLDGGGRPSGEVWRDMLHIADGGVVALHDTYKSNRDLTMRDTVEGADAAWAARAGDLHNMGNATASDSDGSV